MHSTRHGACHLFFLALLLGGCGGDRAGTYAVSGTVTFDGKPLDDGDIIFTPAEGAAVPVAAKIDNGKFRLRSPAGKMQVSIFATREIGGMDPAMGAVPREMYIPLRYNDASVLTADVVADGKNRFEFPLEPGE